MATTAGPIQFGILGCAEIARKVARAIELAPNASLVAVGSRSLDKARRFVADNGLDSAAVRAVGSYEAVLNDPVLDAVYVPLPTSLHARWAVAAAEKGKHLLLEKPPALCTAELDPILDACRSHGVQFMDGTMLVHHPRTAKMKEMLSDSARFGQIKTIHSHFSFAGDSDFLRNDIRVKPDLDALGALGDVGWYCICSILWAVDYELPEKAIALHETVKNDAGVIMHCGASLVWEDGKVATFRCSFLGHLTMELTVVGSNGSLHVSDFVIPFEEERASFSFGSSLSFNEQVTGWQLLPSKHTVTTGLPQEALMVQEFSRLAGSIRDSAGKPDDTWPVICRKTLLVLDAVKASIDQGCRPADVVSQPE